MKIFIVDDEANVRKGLASFFALRDIETQAVGSFAEALEAFAPGEADAALLDLRLGPEGSPGGMELLERMAELDPGLPVIMMSAHADIGAAIEAVRKGAADFLEKPLDQGRLEAVAAQARNRSALRREVRGLEDAWLDEHIAGRKSPAMGKALDLARRAAGSGLSILVRGPSGSGKEAIARFIHLRSGRAASPLVAVNCAAIPPELFESELFGYRKGAFTGAASDRDGLFQSADGGTLFLDEIGELPRLLQPKLLRAIENGEVRRVGGGDEEKVDVRLICATNRNLEAMAAAGDFREDLLFRLAQVTIAVPPLEDRREDIPEIATFLLSRCAQPGVPPKRFSPDALEYLSRLPFRGNVRELRNLVERAACLLDGEVVDAQGLGSLADGEQPGTAEPSGSGARVPEGTAGFALGAFGPSPLKEARDEFDRRYIEAVLERSGGSVVKAAAILGILPNNLSRLMRSLGMRR